MPAHPQDKTEVVCPHCAHSQLEPRQAISTNCRRCGRHLVLQEILHPSRKAGTAPKSVELRRVSCFDCGADLEVPLAAKSSMCKKCSSYLDLQDYVVSSTVSKNFRTKGRVVLEASGCLMNSNLVAREIILKGRLIGKLTAEESLTLFSTAEIKGTLTASRVIIPARNCLHWKDPLRAGSLEVLGELVADVQADRVVTIRASGRLFGSVQAEHLVLEDGAVWVGQARIGPLDQKGGVSSFSSQFQEPTVS